MRLLRVSILVSVMLGSGVSAHAQSEFAATLNGANEVPALDTIAFGSATFDVNFTSGALGLSYELIGVNVTNAFMGHIHCGFEGENGPVMVFLAGQPAAPPNAGYDLNGSWVKARILENAIIPGTPCGSTLTELLIAMVNGRTYVNVHTRAHPAGEIRGQIEVVGPFTLP